MLDFFNGLDHFESLKMRYGEELPKLGLPSYAVPKIHSGLPYGAEGLPERFRDKKNILQSWLGNALYYQYRDFVPKKGNSIVLFTWVMADGLGDLSAQLSVAKRLQKAFPEAKISLITLLSRSEKRRIPLGAFESTTLYYENQEEVVIPEPIFQKMQEASLVLQLPTFYPHWNKIEEELKKRGASPKILHLGQYGFLNSEWYHPKSGNSCMGVHSLEKGLLFEDKVETKPLLNTYFAYFVTTRGASIYLHAVLSSRKNNPQDLYIHLSNPLPLLKVIESESLSGYGLSSALVFDETRQAEHYIADTGKKLFIIPLKDLSPKTVQMEMAKSENFVGCRGDRSFSEVVSQEKFFFYDAPKHSIPFLKDLYELAKHALPFYFSLHAYLKILFDQTTPPKELGEAISDLMLDPALFSGMSEFLALLKRDFSFEESLIHMLQMHLYYQENPEQEKTDLAHFDEWVERDLPIKELLEFFYEKVNSH